MIGLNHWMLMIPPSAAHVKAGNPNLDSRCSTVDQKLVDIADGKFVGTIINRYWPVWLNL